MDLEVVAPLAENGRNEGVQKTPLALALVGLPGVGKTTVASLAAAMLDVLVIDIDSQFEKIFKMTIANCFAEHGEGFFRQCEERILLDAVAGDAGVISTGGGVVVQPSNRTLLKCNTFCIYLFDIPDAIFQRVGLFSQRPMFESVDALEKLRSLHSSRHAHYIESAHETLDINGLTALQTAEKVLSLYKNGRTDL
jgi:shikimate kinase